MDKNEIIMQLTAVSYFENRGKSREWKLEDCTFEGSSLLVGKNATGKTRVLNIIATIARLITGKAKLVAGDESHVEFQVDFKNTTNNYRYILHTTNGVVAKEEFHKNDRRLLARSGNGAGQIYSEPLAKLIDFEPPSDTVAVATRSDKIQHPFLEPLTQWAKRLHHFRFGSSLGRDIIAYFVESGPPVDYFDERHLVGIFRDGEKKHGEKYHDAIIADMKRIGYDIERISLGIPALNFGVVPSGLPTTSFDPNNARWLQVKEKDTLEPIEQHEISQGMFRALSLIAQLNFSALELSPECIIIDDIGEGLDFERSCALISLLCEKASAGKIQLLMSTNDRFVMNAVPLEMWTVLRREGGTVRAYNYSNSKKVFDTFSFTGLNNFDFLATDFIGTGGVQ